MCCRCLLSSRSVNFNWVVSVRQRSSSRERSETGLCVATRLTRLTPAEDTVMLIAHQAKVPISAHPTEAATATLTLLYLRPTATK
jgi:hypothetical protein